jgi:transforming growth factor-beta-induced protein
VLGISSDNATGVSVSFGTDAAKVVTADVTASNGVVHIVDKLLLPPKKPSETAVAAGTFSKLVEALNKVNLTNTIDTTKTLTIFAPNGKQQIFAYAAIYVEEMSFANVYISR